MKPPYDAGLAIGTLNWAFNPVPYTGLGVQLPSTPLDK